MADKMILIDGNSLMYRAFFAVKPMNSASGEPTGALHVFLMMMLGLFESLEPKYCAVAFDLHGPTFRHEDYAEYKAGRAPMPDELAKQMDMIKRILGEMGIAVLCAPGYEADDILGTMSRRGEAEGIHSYIVSGDRDAFQLAGELTTIMYTRKGVKDVVTVTPEYIVENYGLEPVKLIDVKGLMGDSSDNIPGVPGIGEKTALKLICKYGSLERALDAAEADEKGALRDKLISGRESAMFSKRLAAIDREAPVETSIADCEIGDMRGALATLGELNMRQVGERIRGMCATVQEAGAPPERAECEICEVAGADGLREALRGLAPADAAINFGVDASLALDGGRAFVARLGGDLINPGTTESEILEAASDMINNLSGALRVHDVKRMYGLGLPLNTNRVQDVMLAAYVMNPQRKSFALRQLCEDEGVGYVEEAPAVSLGELAGHLMKVLADTEGAGALLHDIELPLAGVLFKIEREGFLTDQAALIQLGESFAQKIDEYSRGIQELAGGPININSPKQLGELLFDRLGLTGGRKTKTGYSTGADVLENLQDQHPIIPMILEYRKYAKLKSTYIDALIKLRDAEGRIHTSFDQTATATGRISSLEPNLQNIPVRTPMGREIRRAFIARPGWVLVDADYSQIELRVLADMSGDEVMREAFTLNQDIHARTAAEVERVDISEVTPEMRSAAKAVNFGIVYGISDFGLARNIGISRQRAADFIERYFARYPGVRKFMDDCVEKGKRLGYVETLFGRRRYLPEMSEANDYNTRKFGERAAMNSPIQGTAADIIKMAMVRVDAELTRRALRSRLILQVHDELIIEAPEDEASAAAELMREAMEGVARLSVPLKVDVNTGRSWYDCK